MQENEKKYSDIYDRISALCRSQNTSPTKLCAEITGSKGNLPTWQKGNINSKALIKIADFLDCSVDYLLGRTDNPKSESNTHIEQNHQYIQTDSSPILVVSPSNNQLDDIHRELLTYFDKLSFKDKAEIMKMVAEKAEC